MISSVSMTQVFVVELEVKCFGLTVISPLARIVDSQKFFLISNFFSSLLLGCFKHEIYLKKASSRSIQNTNFSLF